MGAETPWPKAVGRMPTMRGMTALQSSTRDAGAEIGDENTRHRLKGSGGSAACGRGPSR